MSDYSRGDYADLPAGTTDLENNYTAPDLTAIASNDNSTYAEQTANNEIAIHQYKKTVTGQYTNITWSGKSSLAPSESPVIMEVYNVTGTPAWEELDRDDSTAADTDFDLSYDNLATADYLDTGVITWRVYQAASASAPVTLRFSDNGTGIYLPDEGCTGGADTQIYGNFAHSYNFGSVSPIGLFYVNLSSNSQTLIKFPAITSVIPSNATIDSCKLGLYATSGGGGMGPTTFKIFKLLRNWVEGTGDGSGYQAGSASADEYGGGNAWQKPYIEGSQYPASGDLDRDNTVGQYAVITTPDPYPPGWFTSTDSVLVDHIQSWVDGSNSNYGWIIGEFVSGDSGGTYAPIIAHDGTDGLRPYLEITYHT